jgi:hypothetical protein
MKEKKHSIMELFHKFHGLKGFDDPGDDYNKRVKIFKEILKHPDLNLEVYKKALETDKDILIPDSFHFYWIFQCMKLETQLKTFKEAILKKEGCRTIFDCVVLCCKNLFDWLHINDAEPSLSLLLLKRALKKLEVENDEDYRYKLVLLSLLEAGTVKNHPVRNFFEELDEKYKDYFQENEPAPYIEPGSMPYR